jgi:hypothetical protein
MSSNTYEKGDLVRLSAIFSVSGTATDPDSVTVKVKGPDKVEVPKVYGSDAEVVRDSAGNYHYDLTVDQFGRWFYRWEGTGAVEVAKDGHLFVKHSAFGD